MSVIIEFNKQEKQLLIKRWKQARKIGDGAEGDCYQIDGYVYKVFNGELNIYYNKELYTNDLNLKSFLFPEEIYTSDNKIFASKTRYIQNLIRERRVYAGILPDINKIKKALPQLIEDIYVLSQHNILAIDIAWKNLLFDGKNLYVIDTMNYTRNEEHFNIDAYEWNIVHLQKAIFEFTNIYEEVCQKRNIPLSDDKIKTLHELVYYVKNLSEKVKNEQVDKIMKK